MKSMSHRAAKAEAKRIVEVAIAKHGTPRKSDDFVKVIDIDRDDPVLVRLVEELGDEVNTRYSELKIVEIPDGIEWTVCEYDGLEWVAEAHRTWS